MLNTNSNVLNTIAASAAIGAIAIFGSPAANAQATVTAVDMPTATSVTTITTTTTVTPSWPGTPADIWKSGWAGNETQALIDLRTARGYLALPNKFDLTDDDWSAIHHVSDAIKNLEDNNVYDGYRPYFTPAESVTISHADRLDWAKKWVEKARHEAGEVDPSYSSNISSVISDIDASDYAIQKAIADEDWHQSLTNPSQFMPTGNGVW
jgi:hypothetical protein